MARSSQEAEIKLYFEIAQHIWIVHAVRRKSGLKLGWNLLAAHLTCPAHPQWIVAQSNWHVIRGWRNRHTHSVDLEGKQDASRVLEGALDLVLIVLGMPRAQLLESAQGQPHWHWWAALRDEERKAKLRLALSSMAVADPDASWVQVLQQTLCVVPHVPSCLPLETTVMLEDIGKGLPAQPHEDRSHEGVEEDNSETNQMVRGGSKSKTNSRLVH